MPPRNAPLPNAARLFKCELCDKAYPRQIDFESHLRAYDHNHRQRAADMNSEIEKLTAKNGPESKPKAKRDMRAINLESANIKPAVGTMFTRVGGAEIPAAGGGRFTKVGVPVNAAKMGSQDVKEEAENVKTATNPAAYEVSGPIERAKKPSETQKDEADEVTWEEYDFTKPTGCDHANCPGCKTDGIWDAGWRSGLPA